MWNASSVLAAVLHFALNICLHSEIIVRQKIQSLAFQSKKISCCSANGCYVTQTSGTRIPTAACRHLVCVTWLTPAFSSVVTTFLPGRPWMVAPFPVVFWTTMTFGLEVMGMVVIFVVVPVSRGKTLIFFSPSDEIALVTDQFRHVTHQRRCCCWWSSHPEWPETWAPRWWCCRWWSWHRWSHRWRLISWRRWGWQWVWCRWPGWLPANKQKTLLVYWEETSILHFLYLNLIELFQDPPV